jgi:hypothetical protein
MPASDTGTHTVQTPGSAHTDPIKKQLKIAEMIVFFIRQVVFLANVKSWHPH